LPKALKDRPEADEYVSVWIEDFFILHSRAERISVTEIKNYCETIGFQDVDFFMRVMFEAERLYEKSDKSDKDFQSDLTKKK
jgi:hypothetical protein